MLFELDKKIFLLINGLQNPVLDYFLAWPTYLGTLSIGLPLLLVLIILKDRKSFWVNCLIVSITLIGVDFLVDYLKELIARPRPFFYFEQQGVLINVLFYRPGDFSLPSGHAALSFGAAAILNYLYANKLTWLYGLALLIALSRIYIGVHYPSDVIAGVLLGVVVAGIISRSQKIILNFVNKRQN